MSDYRDWDCPGCGVGPSSYESGWGDLISAILRVLAAACVLYLVIQIKNEPSLDDRVKEAGKPIIFKETP